MPSDTRRRASRGNRMGMLIIAAVVTLLIATMLVQSYKLKNKISTYQTSNAALQEQIEAEKGRAIEYETLPDYIESDDYTEKVAREKFGLVYPGEIVFKAAEN